jgi:hypothetical protein
MKNGGNRNTRRYSDLNQHHSADRYTSLGQTYKRTNKYDVRSSVSDQEDELNGTQYQRAKYKKLNVNNSLDRRCRKSCLNDDMNESLHELHQKVSFFYYTN